MVGTPRLSICVPSRNRQYYFQKTIEGMIRNPRMDVQFIFADNSDDPSIMNDYMAAAKQDPRVIYLPSGDRTFSMMENWERTVAASTGDWVTVIGDDDHCEPDVIDAINRCTEQLPDLEALSWGCVAYRWPTPDEPQSNVGVPLHATTIEVTQDHAVDRMFRWVDARAVPTSGFSIYHSAISRELLERIKRRYCGTYFEYPNVDYEMAMKVIHTGRRFVYCQRPFSVMGSCPQSNSFAVARPKDSVKKNETFTKEARRNIDEDEQVRDFPFKMDVGMTGAIAMTQHWFKKKYKINVKDWEINFAKACAFNTEVYGDLEAFEESRARYTKAFSIWKEGRFLKYYQPEFKSQEQGLAVTGFTDDIVFIKTDALGIETPAELFDIVNAISHAPEHLEINLQKPTNKMISEAEAMALNKRRA